MAGLIVLLVGSLAVGQATQPQAKQRFWSVVEGAPADVRAYVESWPTMREHAIFAAQADLDGFSKQRIAELDGLVDRNEEQIKTIAQQKRYEYTRTTLGQSKKVLDQSYEREKSRKISTLRREIASFKKERGDLLRGDPHPGILGERLEVGQFGTLPLKGLHVSQIIDKRSAICDIGSDTSIKLDGVDFSNQVDGRPIVHTGVFRIAGTYTYETTIGGTRTIFRAEPVDLEKYIRVDE